ncbi:microcephalin-like [Ostrinia nubilalis]|uniref:microcephalin-like n=1 Tax=Ostrinia nubilalis TaxID=29057 RepID=UPI003082598F
MENISLLDLLSDKEDDKNKPRLRLSSETELDTSEEKTTDTSHDSSRDRSTDASRDKTDIETRVNTAPRRALPVSISPAPPAKSRRKLFTQKEAEETKNTASDDESDADTTKPPKAAKPTQRSRKCLARAERLARKLVAAATPRVASANVHKPRIVLTGMGRSERQELSTAIRSMDGRIQAHVTRKTTHVLLGSCRDDDENHCSGIASSHLNPNRGVTVTKCSDRTNVNCDYRLNNCDISGVTNINDLRLSGVTNEPLVVHRSDIQKARTLNALAGAARGCRVLYAKWATDSKEAGKWIHHHGYEVPHLRKISLKARIERSALGRMRSEYAYDIFNGMKVLITPQTDQKVAALQLLKLCGAVIIDGSTGQHGVFDMTLGSSEGEVSSKWVFDSVAAGRMRTTRRYVNNPLSCTVITQSDR